MKLSWKMNNNISNKINPNRMNKIYKIANNQNSSNNKIKIHF